MSRRSTAEQHRKTEQNRPPMTGARHYVSGSGAVTPTERQASAEGIKAGATLRLRQRAAELVQTNAALAAEGLATDYRMPERDRDGEPLDARDVLAEAESRARGHRKGKWLLADEQRMTSADVAKLADYGRRCARRMTRGAMPDADLDDVAADLMLAVLERGQDGAEDPRCRDWFRAPYGTPRADARVSLLEGRLSDLPAWSLLAPADGAPGSDDGARAVSRWRGFSYLEARRAVGDWRARMDAETAADWSDPGEDGPTPEQRAAAAADSAGAVLTEALTAAAPLTHFLALTAPGDAPLKPAERDALALAVTGLSRADLAAARGVDANTVKVGAQRGRKHLSARVSDLRSAEGWARAADYRMRAALTAPLWSPERDLSTARETADTPLLSTAPATDAERLAAAMSAARVVSRHTDHGAPGVKDRSATRAWPDRAAEYGEDGAMTLPGRSGAGTRANRARPVIGCAERAPMPRATVSGAPTLPPHRLLATTASTGRALNRLARDWFTRGYGERTQRPAHADPATVSYRTLPAPTLAPATIISSSPREVQRMRADAAYSRQRAAKWDAPAAA